MTTSGIDFKSIILTSLKYYRSEKMQESAEISLNFDEKSIDIKDDSLSILMDCLLVDKAGNGEVNQRIDIQMQAQFVQTENESSVSLETFSKYSGPAYMVPFFRELIQNITSRSGMRPILLPPVNIKKIRDEAVKNKTEKD